MASNPLRGYLPNKQRTCVPPVVIRAMPENEIPPAMRVDFLRYSVFIWRNTVDNWQNPQKVRLLSGFGVWQYMLKIAKNFC